MKNALLAAMLLFFSQILNAQTIVKGTGVLYTNGAPNLVATQSADAEIAIDTTTGFWYEYNRDALSWSAAGFRIQLRNACTTPVHTPGDKQSYVLLDTCDNLYRYRNGTWTQIGGAGGATDLGYTGTNSPITLTSSTGADVTITEGGIVDITASGSNMTISATEADGSVTNEGQLGVGAGGANTATITTNTSGGNPVTVSGGGILAVTETTSTNGGTITLTATEVDGSITNEGILGVGAGGASSSTLVTNTSTGNAVTINVAGINSISESTSSNGGSITITATEVDGSTSNELQTIANTSDATTHTVTLSNSGGSVQLVEGSNITLTTSGTGLDGVVTIAATGASVTANNGISDNENSGNIRLGNRYMNTPDAPFTMDRKVNVDGNKFYIGDNTDSTLLQVDGTNDRIGIGTTTPGRKLTVNGEVQIQDLTTTSATLIVGADANGVLSEVTVGSGLDLTAGVLTATGGGGGGSTDLSYTGTNSPITLNSSTGTDVTITEGGIVDITASGSNMTISATEVDGSITNEGQLGVGAGAANTATITTNTSGGNPVTVEAAGILSVSETTSANGGTIVLTATEVDGSTSNELQTYSHAGTTTYTNTLSNGGGSWSITGAGIAVISQTAGAVTVTATEVDGSVTNEGQLGVGAGGASSSVLLSNTSGATGVTINVAGINSISETTSANGGQITITATEVDGSTSNELQTIANTSNATSHTATLSNSGGSVQFVEGTGIGLATTGTGLDGVLTITNTSPDQTVTLTEGGIVDITGSYPSFTISATEVDGSTTNEAWTIDADDADTEVISNQTVKFQGAGITTTDYNPTTDILLITSTEADGSLTNEGQLGVGAGGATSSVITSNTSGATGVTINAAGILAITESTSSNGGSITLTATEVDGSTTNELQTIANTSDATTHTVTLSSSGGSVQLVEGSNIALTTTGTASDGIVTISATSTADGNGPYSGNGGNGGNGTIPSVTTSTVTNQWTISRATDDVGGLVPLRVSVAAGNEPDFMSFVNGSDSLLISKGDQEFQIEGNKTVVLQSTEIVSIIADSVQIQAVPNNIENERTLLLLGPSGTIVKSEGLDPDIINQNGAASGEVLKWNGTKWAPAADAGGGSGDINQNGNSFGAAFVIGTNDNNTVSLEQNGTTAVTIGTDKNITAVNSVAATAATTDRLVLQTNSTGTAAANFGGGVLFQAESSTTDNQDLARVRAYWTTATHASREGALSWMLGDAGGALTEAMKLDRVNDSEGNLSIGTTTPVQIDNDGITTATTFAIGNSAQTLRLGNSSGEVEFIRETSATGVPNQFVFDSRSTGTAANGFGLNLSLKGESSTTQSRDLGVIQALWTTATDASRTSDLVFAAVNNTNITEGLRIKGSGRVETANLLRIGTLGTTATTILGRNASEDVASVTIGSGLSLSGGTLSATSAPSVISPSQITTDQDNYNPTGWDGATTVRLSFDSDINAITSFDIEDSGERKVLMNVGTSPGYLPCDHPDGTATQRIKGGADYILPPGESIEIEYDGFTEGWRVIGQSFSKSDFGVTKKGLYINAFTPSATQGDNEYFTFTTTGTGAAITAKAATTGLFRGLSLATGTTSTGAAAAQLLRDGEVVRFGDGHLCFFGQIYIPTLSTSGQRFTADMSFGLINGTVAALPDRSAFGFRYSDNLNTGRWQLYSYDISQVQSTADSGITVAANTVYNYCGCIDKSLSEARFYINGAYVGRVTANMPSTAHAGVVRQLILKSVGTTSTEVVTQNSGILVAY